MLNAALKLVAITVGVLIAVSFAVFALRSIGLRQDGTVPPQAWFERPRWSFARPPADDLCATPPSPRPEVILVLPVRKTPVAWEVACASSPKLEDFLKRTTHVDWLIEVEAGVAEDLDNFVDIVNKSGTRRIGIHAASQRAARHLRKSAPGWAFAADDASLLRLHLSASFFLEPVLEFWPDFVLVHAADEFTPRELNELRRRKRRIVWFGEGEPPWPVDGQIRAG